VEDVMKKNDKIKKANEELEYLSGDAEVRRIAELREKALKDMASAENYGFSKGKEEGRKEGREEGKKERDYEIVKAMLKENVSIEFISKVTSLSKEEIENLM